MRPWGFGKFQEHQQGEKDRPDQTVLVSLTEEQTPSTTCSPSGFQDFSSKGEGCFFLSFFLIF